MSLLPPSAKKVKLASSSRRINELGDAELCEIFKRLPPLYRLNSAMVCRRWFGLIRRPWTDAKHLDLGPIFGKDINVIVNQCPNLMSVSAFDRPFGANELARLTNASALSSVKFYDCEFEVDLPSGVASDAVPQIFTASLPQASWRELVLHVAYIGVFGSSNPQAKWFFSAEFLPASLTRLQLTGLGLRATASHHGNDHHVTNFLNGLQRLENLECLMLHGSSRDELVGPLLRRVNVFEKIGGLKNLKELCLGPVVHPIGYKLDLKRMLAALPKLEVLFLDDLRAGVAVAGRGLSEVITKSATLKILVLAGEAPRPLSITNVVPLRARQRLPGGPGTNPLPLLHIFVNKIQRPFYQFERPKPDAAVMHKIDAPMAEFLERPEVAEIFKGVWVAEQLKEAAKHGLPII